MSLNEKPSESLSLNPRIRHRAVGDDGVVVHLDNGRVMVVNEVGRRVVELLSQPHAESELARRLADEFEVTAEQAETDLRVFLEQLDSEQVLTRHSRGAE
ncbi:MAG: PqqD family protein [Gammaproteobacteria bacterium]|nr:PqqD family protein [Gammaproteobacteria bacterium]